MEKSMTKIGFIGLGNMGSKMVVHLLKSGYEVQGYDLDETLIDPLLEFGITKADSLENFANNKNVIITMLPNGDIVEKVMNEIINDIKADTILIDTSTINVDTSKKLNQEFTKKGIFFLDAPVSGGTIGAANGTLTFMVGGNFSTFQNISPILDLMGSKSVYCGKSGSGQAVKLCNNMLLAITMIGVSESFNMAEKLDIDLNILFEVISTATGSCWSINKYCPVPSVGPVSPADNNYEAGFSAKLMSKDLKLAIEAGKKSSSNIPFGMLAEELFTKMAEGKNGNKDFSGIIREIN
jgi:3-hydroxyisobutyrate dehydrogenase